MKAGEWLASERVGYESLSWRRKNSYKIKNDLDKWNNLKNGKKEMIVCIVIIDDKYVDKKTSFSWFYSSDLWEWIFKVLEREIGFY